MAVSHPGVSLVPTEAAQALAGVRFLGHAPRHELVALLDWARLRRYGRGDVVRQPGTAGLVYSVLHGALHLCQASSSGHEIASAYFFAGDSYGLAFFDETPASSSALIAAVPSTCVCCIPTREVRRLVTRYPAVATDVILCLSQSVRSAHEAMRYAAFASVRQRLIYALLRLDHGSGTGPIAVTQGDLAAMIGTSREQVTREMGHLRAEGFVRRVPGTRGFTLLHLAALQQAAETEFLGVR